jgi:hypothetical protein
LNYNNISVRWGIGPSAIIGEVPLVKVEVSTKLLIFAFPAVYTISNESPGRCKYRLKLYVQKVSHCETV